MYKTQLFSVLKPLSTRERSRFKSFLESPFFNKNKEIRAFGNHLLATPIKEQNKQLNRLLVYRKVYGEEAFDEQKFNNLVSDMLQLYWRFLAHLQLDSNESLQLSLVIEQFQDRDLTQHIPKTAKRFQKILAKSPHQNYTYYQYQYLLYEGLDAAFLSQSKHSNDPNLQLKSDHFDLYYISNKLRIACDMLSRNTVVNADYQAGFLDNILAYYEQHKAHLSVIPAVSNYYLIYQLLLHPQQETLYQQIKEALAQTWQLYPAEEARTLYSFLLNYCVKQINSGKPSFYKEILELYQFLLQHKIIIRHDSITRWTFTNILMAAIRLQEFAWAKEFILTYEVYLPTQERSNVVTYNLANLYYAQQDYQKALLTLHNVEFNDTSFHTGAKIIQMKCYYDLQETDALFALLDAFKMYILRSKKLSSYQKRANKNMLTLVQKIYQVQQSKPILTPAAFEQSYQKLLKRLEKANPVANKQWIERLVAALVIG